MPVQSQFLQVALEAAKNAEKVIMQHYAHAIAQLCDLYLHTAMLLHSLLTVAAQPLIDAATLLGTTL